MVSAVMGDAAKHEKVKVVYEKVSDRRTGKGRTRVMGKRNT